jgi:Wiskott-Aldrich syndrome protein
MTHLVPLRSPATPTGLGLGFTQHPEGFNPDFVSSQKIPGFVFGSSGAGYGSWGSAGGGVARTGTGSSGFQIPFGYNSQFDVEGQVDRVSELLERDVDFEGWLKDLPVEEGVGS